MNQAIHFFAFHWPNYEMFNDLKRNIHLPNDRKFGLIVGKLHEFQCRLEGAICQFKL